MESAFSGPEILLISSPLGPWGSLTAKIRLTRVGQQGRGLYEETRRCHAVVSP